MTPLEYRVKRIHFMALCTDLFDTDIILLADLMLEMNEAIKAENGRIKANATDAFCAGVLDVCKRLEERAIQEAL